jgi:hypothetical protein
MSTTTHRDALTRFGYAISHPTRVEILLALRDRVIEVSSAAAVAWRFSAPDPEDDEYCGRFTREADLAAKVWHPHIVGVHDPVGK